MASDKEKEAAKIILDVGKHLSQQTRMNKDSLVKLIRKAEDAFQVLGQSSSLKSAIEPLSDSLTRHSLLQHKDKDVRVLVASCLCQIMRVLAPDPAYNDETYREVFKLIISMFAELVDTKSPYFTRRVKILETVAKLKCCVLLLDIDGGDGLVLEMFNVFFSVVSDHHQHSLFQAISSIITLILEEKGEVPQPLLDVILRNLLREEKGAGPAFRLAVSIIQRSAAKLEPVVRGFLRSSILERDAIASEVKEYYHEIIFEIFQCAPRMLLAVIPNLTHELLTDQVDVRIKAVNLLQKLFALPGCRVAQDYDKLFKEFLRRFTDKSAEVRISALQCAKAFYMANPSGTETREVLVALEGRLLDFDDKVRTQAVVAVCDLAKSNLKCISPELILRAIDRLRDKKVSVRKTAVQKLLELYRDYCIQCSDTRMTLTDHFEQIPCRTMMLCYDKDCKDFRPQNMELVLATDLFPVTLSVEERMRHWISLFSLFSHAHVKALTSILSQKWRLQMEMRAFLSLREKEKENRSDELQEKMKTSFRKISASFVDPSKAEECFQKLQQMKDNSIFKDLMKLLDEGTDFVTAYTIRETLLERVGNKHPLCEFLRALSLKCSFNIFGSEHVRHILSELLTEGAGNKHLEASAVNLLLIVVSICPSLLRGSEEQLKMLLCEDDCLFNDKLLQILSKAGRYISIELSEVYPSLERICLEGTRLQSKYAISAIAALGGSSEHSAFSDLCEKLLESLQARKNIPTVLQSLGCMSQYSVSAYESREKEITKEIIDIVKTRIHPTVVQSSNDLDLFDDDSGCSASCKLKIYGLKTLVKSFLPHQGTSVRRQLNDLLIILSKLLPEGEISDVFSSGSDKVHIRLAAAKSVLRLARKWDLHISPQIFHLTVLKAKDPSSLVRRTFLNKIHKLLREHDIPRRYACAFALAASNCLKDVQADSLKYMEGFIREYSKDARIHQTSAINDQGGNMTKYPEYIVTFLIHVLAHDPCFPSEDCLDEHLYAKVCSPMVVVLQALVSASSVASNKNVVDDPFSRILNIFRAIRKAEDAVDFHKTPKLHFLADISMLIVKALSPNGLSLSPSGVILLPSSFYKVSRDPTCKEADLNLFKERPFDENFVDNVLRIIERHITGVSISPTKSSRKYEEDNLKLDSSKSTMDFPLPKLADKSRSKTKEEKQTSYSQKMDTRKTKQKINTRVKSKRSVSPDSTGSMETRQHKKGANGSTASNLGRDQVLSSCGSAITKPSVSESRGSTKEGQIIQYASLEESNKTRRKSGTEPCKFSVTNPKKCSDPKGVGDMRDAEIGQRIKLWSPDYKCFRSGSVDGYDSQNGSHKILYDNGEVELVRLANEKWEIVNHVSSPKEATSKLHSMPRRCQGRRALTEPSNCDPEVNSTISNLNEFPNQGNKASELTTANKKKGYNNDNGAVPVVAGGAEKRKIGRKPVSVTSEVMDVDATAIARRTRSRKA